MGKHDPIYKTGKISHLIYYPYKFSEIKRIKGLVYLLLYIMANQAIKTIQPKIQ